MSRGSWCASLVGSALAAVVLTAVGTVGGGTTLRTAQAPQPRPNIVVVLMDDMRKDELRFMPRTRRLLGERGATFVNALSPNPLCCPARASALTGLYSHNHRVYDVAVPYGFTAFRDGSTFATWLQAAGYTTTYIGKYLNGYGSRPAPGRTEGTSLSYVPPGWSRWFGSIDGGLPSSHPKAGTTYRYLDTTLSNDGRGFLNFDGQYQSAVYGRLAADEIRARSSSDRPFLLHVSFTAPHHGSPEEQDDPGSVARDDGRKVRFVTPARPVSVRGRFDRSVRQPPGAAWRDPDFSDKPRYLTAPSLNRAERAALLEVARQRAEALWVVDRQVQRIVEALRAGGELGRTVLLFTSDNGYYLGEQRRRQGKVFHHDPSVRVPLLLRGPGVPPGVVRRDPFLSLDLAPTLAAAAGVAPGRPVDGMSMLRVARRGDRGWTRAVLLESAPWRSFVRPTDEGGGTVEPGEVRDVRFSLGVRTGRYLYVDTATGERELYDLARDRQQYANVVASPRYGDVVRRMAEALRALRTCAGAGCRSSLAPGIDGVRTSSSPRPAGPPRGG